MPLLDLNHDVLGHILSQIHPSRDLRGFVATCRAAHALALPYFLADVRLHYSSQVIAFCKYMLDPARLRYLRSLTIDRGASVVREPPALLMKLAFPSDAPVADLLARAPCLAHVHIRLVDHVLARVPNVTDALLGAPHLTRLELGDAGTRAWDMLARWPAARGLREMSLEIGDIDVAPLLAPHRGTLRVLSLAGGFPSGGEQFSGEADDPSWAWPKVTDLTLQNVSAKREALVRAFPSLRRLRALDGLKKRSDMLAWSSKDPESVSGPAWTQLEDVLVDVAAVCNLGLAAPDLCPALRRLELARSSINEKTSFMANHFLDADDDPSTQMFLALVRTTTPASLTFRLRPSSIEKLTCLFKDMAVATQGSLRFLHVEFFARSQVYWEALRLAIVRLLFIMQRSKTDL
jgi:hypothetical protein